MTTILRIRRSASAEHRFCGLNFIGRLALEGWSLCLTGQLAFAQAFPVKPIRLIAPFSAGGGADTVASLVGRKVSELLAQQVIVDNRPGAGNVIGTGIVARAAPDDPKFGEILKFTEWVSDQHPHKFRVEGSEVVVDTSV